MARSTKEWIGKADDAPVPPRVRLRVFMRLGGICQCGCNRPIRPGEPWQTDHRVALINGGQHRESNLQPLIVEHHKGKTREDVAEKSRTHKRRLRHHGIRKPKHIMPGARASRFKKRMDGTVELRNHSTTNKGDKR